MNNRNFDPFPILTTERLTLRQLTIEDQNDILALRSDPEINKYLGRQPSKNIDDAISFINMVNDNIKLNNSLYWAITLSSTQKMVGTICLFNFLEENNSCEIGYELMTNFHGQGLMTEATKAVIDFAFKDLKITTMLACIHYENQNSSKLLLKFNFVKSTETDKENPNMNIFILKP